MSNIEIVQFENKHAEQILDIGLNSELLELKPEHRKYAYYLEEVGMSFTGLINGKPIAAGKVSKSLFLKASVTLKAHNGKALVLAVSIVYINRQTPQSSLFNSPSHH